MPNNNDRKIIERLTNDSALEMKRHELEELLDTELNKPAEEIDAQMVTDLLNALHPEKAPSGLEQKIWRRVKQQLHPKPQKTHRLLKRLTAIAAIVVLLFGLTIGAARAFRWTFLLKLLQPVAETFGIYMNYSGEEISTDLTEDCYSVSEDVNATAIHHDLCELPDTHDGYAIKPRWIPDGYIFKQATSFSEINMTKYSIDYLRGTDEITIAIAIHTDPESVASYNYERTSDKTTDRRIGIKLVTFYRNTDDSLQLVSWIDNEAHYSISGDLSIPEIERMVSEYPDRMPE